MDKTRELTVASKAQATKVEGQAREVTNVARGAAQASQRQRAAFEDAMIKAKDADAATEKAKAAFRCVSCCCLLSLHQKRHSGLRSVYFLMLVLVHGPFPW